MDRQIDRYVDKRVREGDWITQATKIISRLTVSGLTNKPLLSDDSFEKRIAQQYKDVEKRQQEFTLKLLLMSSDSEIESKIDSKYSIRHISH